MRAIPFLFLLLGWKSSFAQVPSPTDGLQKAEDKNPVAGSTDSSWYYLNDDGNFMLGVGFRSPFPRVVNNRYFNKYLIVFAGYTSDEEKLSNARIEFGHWWSMNGKFSSWQIKKLVQKISEESNQLILIKEAYPFCFDPQNYRQIHEVLQSAASHKALNEFISEQKR